MTKLVCLLEEASAEEMLKEILIKILPLEQAQTTKYIPFEGKQDMDKHIEKRLKGWKIPDDKFLILRDKDSGNCKIIKQAISEKVIASGKQNVTLIRIACYELESFYLGDLAAVRAVFPKMPLISQDKQKYRNPDNLPNPAKELEKLTKGVYQKIAGSRAIAAQLTLDGRNTSRSFNVLINGLKTLMQEAQR